MSYQSIVYVLIIVGTSTAFIVFSIMFLARKCKEMMLKIQETHERERAEWLQRYVVQEEFLRQLINEKAEKIK